MNTNFTFSFLALIYILLSYLVGSIPTGVWYSIAKHKMDVRTMGSGNSGGTNVGRNFGLKAAVIVTAVDVLKGWIPVLLAKIFFPEQAWAIMLSAIACVLGHAYPILAGFRGGKIVATSIGVLLAYNFSLALFQVLVLFALLYITSIMSFSALVSFGAATLYILIASPEWEYKLGFLLIYCFMLYRHRVNVKNLLNNQERMLDWGMKLNLPFDTSKLEDTQIKFPKIQNFSLKNLQLDKFFVRDKTKTIDADDYQTPDSLENNFDPYQDLETSNKPTTSRYQNSRNNHWKKENASDAKNNRYHDSFQDNMDNSRDFDKYSDYDGPVFDSHRNMTERKSSYRRNQFDSSEYDDE